MPICCWPLVSTDRKTKVIWPLLVEKAIAKEYGSYDNMEGGATDYALMLITGEPAFRYRLNNETVQQLIADGSLWRKLVTYSEKGFLMGAGTLPKCEIPALVDSLRDSHAYTILDALEFDGNRLLKLKDPWGISSWGGDWSARSAKWTHRMREYVARRKLVKRERRRKTAEECKTLMNIRTRRGRGNSSFYISWEDFIRSFEVIFVSMRFDTALWGEQTIRDKWTEGRAGGSSENIDTVKDNPQYLLKVAERIEVYCLLIQLIPPAKKGTLDTMRKRSRYSAGRVRDIRVRAEADRGDRTLARTGGYGSILAGACHLS